MRKYPQIRLLGLIALCASVSFVPKLAIAQTPDQAEMISRADANDDGNISWEEITALRSSSFERLDRNSDGVINSKDRPIGPMAGRFDEAFEKVEADFDVDRDGEITHDEMLNAPAPMFEQADVNSDGVVTADEMSAFGPDILAQ